MPAEKPTDIAFMPFAESGGFIAHNGPYYWGREASGELVYGFQSDARHGNPNGVLHGAAVSPWRRACDLSVEEWRRVAGAGDRILRRATACRGTSISDWHDLHGKKGTYQRHLAVYGRAGSACMRCGESVQRSVLGGRGTFFCPRCQPHSHGESGRPLKR